MSDLIYILNSIFHNLTILLAPSLYTLNETFTNSLSYSSLYVISLYAALCGVLVIIRSNPIVSILFLIALFLNIAAYIFMIGLNFIGLAYILVYVGAVSILFLFILMLINIRTSEFVTENYNSVSLATIIGWIFGITLFSLFAYSSGKLLYEQTASYENIRMRDLTYYYYISLAFIFLFFNTILDIFISYNNQNLWFVTSDIWDDILTHISDITSIGSIIYTAYPLWLILTSIILLLAMVGAIVITIKKK